MLKDDTPDWIAIKEDYLAGKVTIAAICLQHNVSQSAVMQHRRRYGWPGRNKMQTPSRKLLIARMFLVLEKQIEKMEIALIDRSDDKEIALLGQLVRTLEKLVELDTKQRSAPSAGDKPKGKTSREMLELREKLSRRINRLETE